MKKIFKTFIIGIIAIFFLIPNQIFAAPYPLTAIVGDKGITVTMSGVPTTDTSSYQLYNGTNPIVQNDLVGTDTLVKKATNGSVVWVLGGLAFRNGTYAFHVERLPVGIVTPLTPSVVVTDTKTVTVTTSTTTSDFFTWPLLFPITSGQTATVIGKIDTLKYPNTDGLSVEFSYTKTPFTTTTTPSDLKISKAHKSLGAGSVEGVASDGSYYFEITDLTPDTKYYFRQTITDKATGAVLGLIKTDDFNSTKGYTPAGSVKDNADFDSRSYRLLAPWPGLAVLMDPDLCAEKKAEGSLAPGAICDVNGFLNFAFKLLIGLTAVVLVLRLMYEGYQYMVTDVPFLKASAKSDFFTALLGLLLALSAYLILNTINPKLVNNQITIDSVEVGVEDFIISGALSGDFSGKPIKVNFNKKAYPAALTASQKTGVDVAFILAIFAQETSSGANLGTCVWNAPGVMPGPGDKQSGKSKRDDQTAFKQIMSELQLSPESKAVSCPNSGGGWGGGMGYTQFIPTTWLEQRIEAGKYLGHAPNPWNLEDALMTTAVYLKNLNGISEPQNAACRYYSGRVCDNKSPANSFYGINVMKKRLSLQKQITDARAKGEIK